ncbi:MAG: hypothetical protein ACRDYV_00235 [Acidimicrobiia bacterium]
MGEPTAAPDPDEVSRLILDDLAAVHDLATEVASTRRLIAALVPMVDQIVARVQAHERRVDQINGGDPGAGSPTRMDQILFLSGATDPRLALRALAERICAGTDWGRHG